MLLYTATNAYRGCYLYSENDIVVSYMNEDVHLFPFHGFFQEPDKVNEFISQTHKEGLKRYMKHFTGLNMNFK
jgi:hypothetical protein